ncbi:putative disease resistance protein RGA4 isoform X3 [Mangifera indica]|uniref:putative disease resistance protein RGA4 isoform X3 n=1 Tax=Mangifera indica TaxID=29780 RepID=UPI001CFAACB5|nr:putative disease resistance protein RGA4 isoform X3 [Mangifera indica]
MEVVLEPVVSELVDGLFKILGSKEVRDFARKLVGGVDSEIKELESKLRMVEDLLRNAEDRQLMDKRVKEWLDNLQHWAYDAEDILDEFAYEALRHKREAEHQASSSKVFSLPASFSSPLFAFQMGSKIKKINSRLEKLRQQRSAEREFQKLPGLPPTNIAAPQKPEETSSVPLGQVYGRNEDEVELLKMVKSGANFQPIAVVGVGGIGKTTIAREVYNHKELEDIKFEKKAWVCVSTTFDVLTISKKLLQQFSSPVPDNLNDVQVKLKEAVSGKKFLIVLDDIWKVEYIEWEKLKSPLAAGALGSTMIVTTRHEHVAKEIRSSHTHRLSLLSDGDCKSLFQEHAFGTGAAANADQISISIYERVLKRCKGLPLAAKTLGCLLRSKPSDTWEKILDSKIWSTFNESDHILPALKLSYHYLPSNLKRCFGYCAIFPQDYEFEEKELALLWIAEGIVQPSNEQLDEAEMPYGMKKLKNLQVLSNFIVGEDTHSYLEDLRSLSFLQGELHISELQNVTDLNHIQGQILSNKSKLKVLILEWRDQVNSQTRDVEMNLLDKLKPPVNLRELTIRGYGGESFPSWLRDLSWLSNLRVFTIEKCLQLIGEIPNYFSSLERFVIKDCPKLVVSLSNYPIGCKLEINNCKGMVCNDGSIDFENLDSEYLANISTVEDKLKKGSQRVYHLMIVHNEEIMKSWQSLENTNFLSNINSLTISMCQNLRSIGRGMLPLSLEEFDINFCESLTFIDSDALPLSLKRLRIRQCGELKFLKDLSVCSLLEYLEIFFCESLKYISLDGPLPETLNELVVQGCEALETLSSRRNEYLPKALTSICILDCEELKSIAESFDNSTCLQYICVVDCKNLESLPSGLHHLPCLYRIGISGCPKLSVREGVPTSLRQLLINECEDDKGMGMGTGTGMLTSLKTLEIFSLPQLKSISDLTNVTALERLDIISLPLLESISDLTNLTSLKWLQINNLPQLELISNLSGLTSLTELYIDKCQKLKSIPSLSGLTSLEVLLIHNLPQLETFPSFSGLTSLERLNIAKLPQLESIPNLSGLTSLKDLQISECPRIKSIRSLSGLTSLQQLRIADLPQLESIQDLSSLTSLEDLQISECPRIKSIRSLSGLTSLQQLRIADLPQLESIQDLSSLTSLEDLQISECPRIKSIRSLSGLTSLQQLRIADLPQLESIQDLSNLTSLEDLQISKCPRIKSIPSLSSLTSLQSLRITDCPLLIKRWKSVTGKYSSKIAQIPKVEIDGKFIYNSKEYEVDDWSFFL